MKRKVKTRSFGTAERTHFWIT